MCHSSASTQALRHSEASIISSFIRHLLSSSKSFVELKTRSHSALIAGIDRRSKAILAKDGYLFSCCCQNAHKSTDLGKELAWINSSGVSFKKSVSR
jgi:hypothetical protein